MDELYKDLLEAIKKFQDSRREKGGIMLPDATIVNSTVDAVMRELEMIPPLKTYHIIGEKNASN